jgi:hypothetical protein
MTPRFYDGIFAEANRTNEACGRSYHIPAKPRRVAFGFVTAVQFAAVTLPVAIAWAVLG